MIRLAFHASLYERAAVDAAAEAYAGLARIAVSGERDAIVVTLDEVDAGADADVVDSFCNHVLFETVLRARTAAGDVTP